MHILWVTLIYLVTEYKQSIYYNLTSLFPFEGTAEEKAKLMFDMYDITGNGTLTKVEFKVMLK